MDAFLKSIIKISSEPARVALMLGGFVMAGVFGKSAPKHLLSNKAEVTVSAAVKDKAQVSKKYASRIDTHVQEEASAVPRLLPEESRQQKELDFEELYKAQARFDELTQNIANVEALDMALRRQDPRFDSKRIEEENLQQQWDPEAYEQYLKIKAEEQQRLESVAEEITQLIKKIKSLQLKLNLKEENDGRGP
jgi:hypothetical protein